MLPSGGDCARHENLLTGERVSRRDQYFTYVHEKRTVNALPSPACSSYSSLLPLLVVACSSRSHGPTMWLAPCQHISVPVDRSLLQPRAVTRKHSALPKARAMEDGDKPRVAGFDGAVPADVEPIKISLIEMILAALEVCTQLVAVQLLVSARKRVAHSRPIETWLMNALDNGTAEARAHLNEGIGL